MTPEGKFFTIIFACEERYSHDLINELVGGVLTTENRVGEVLDLVNQNLPEEQMMIALKEIRKRDNIPYEDMKIMTKIGMTNMKNIKSISKSFAY